MPFAPPPVKHIVQSGAAAIILAVIVNAGYSLIALQRQNAPLSELPSQIQGSAPYFILGLFLAAVAAIIGNRLAAGLPKKNHRLTGLKAGVGLALIVIAVSFTQGNFRMGVNAVMAIFGGWIGGRST
jgi:hypothetical protein